MNAIIQISKNSWYIVRKEFTDASNTTLKSITLFGKGFANERLARSAMFEDPATMKVRKPQFIDAQNQIYRIVKGKYLLRVEKILGKNGLYWSMMPQGVSEEPEETLAVRDLLDVESEPVIDLADEQTETDWDEFVENTAAGLVLPDPEEAHGEDEE